MEDQIKEEEPFRTYDSGKKNAQEHADVAEDSCSREGLHIEDVGQHIRRQAEDDEEHKLQKFVSGV